MAKEPRTTETVVEPVAPVQVVATPPLPQGNAAVDTTVHAKGEPYETSGKTLVRARWGYQFRSSNENLPMVTPEGVYMTAAEADEVLAEAAFENTAVEDLVYRVTETEEG